MKTKRVTKKVPLKFTAAAAGVLLALASGAALAQDVTYTSIGSFGSEAPSQPVLNITGDNITIGSDTLAGSAVQLGGIGNSIVISADASVVIQNNQKGYFSNNGKATIDDFYTDAETTGKSAGDIASGNSWDWDATRGNSLTIDSKGTIDIINAAYQPDEWEQRNGFGIAISVTHQGDSISINKSQTAERVTIIGDIVNNGPTGRANTPSTLEIWLTGNGSKIDGVVSTKYPYVTTITLAPSEGGTALLTGGSETDGGTFTLTAGSGSTIEGVTLVTGSYVPFGDPGGYAYLTLTGNAVQKTLDSNPFIGLAEYEGTYQESAGPDTTLTGDFSATYGSKMTLNIAGSLTGSANVSGGGWGIETPYGSAVLELNLSGTWKGDTAALPADIEPLAYYTSHKDFGDQLGVDLLAPGESHIHILNGGSWTGSATAKAPNVTDNPEKPQVGGPGGKVTVAVDAGGTWTGDSVAEGGAGANLKDQGATVSIDISGGWTGNAESKAATAIPSEGSGGYTDVTVRTGGTWTGDITAEETTLTGQTGSSGSADVKIAGTWTGSSTASTDTTLTDPAIVNVSLTESTGLWNVTKDSSVTALDIGSGKVSFTRDAGTFAGKTLTVAGNYTGNGGTIAMNTVLADDNAATDKLVVKGNTAGTTTLTFTNVGGAGAQTVDGIRVVEVGGTSDGVFTKPADNILKAGAYVYHLEKVGTDWYLVSTKDVTPEPDTPAVIPDSGDITTHVMRPENGSYANNLYAANTLFNMSLYERLGDTMYSDALRTKDDTKSGNVWVRALGGHTRNKMEDGDLTTRGNWGGRAGGGRPRQMADRGRSPVPPRSHGGLRA